jgi:hypothetical protein
MITRLKNCRMQADVFCSTKTNSLLDPLTFVTGPSSMGTHATFTPEAAPGAERAVACPLATSVPHLSLRRSVRGPYVSVETQNPGYLFQDL